MFVLLTTSFAWGAEDEHQRIVRAEFDCKQMVHEAQARYDALKGQIDKAGDSASDELKQRVLRARAELGNTQKALEILQRWATMVMPKEECRIEDHYTDLFGPDSKWHDYNWGRVEANAAQIARKTTKTDLQNRFAAAKAQCEDARELALKDPKQIPAADEKRYVQAILDYKLAKVELRAAQAELYRRPPRRRPASTEPTKS